MTSSEEWIAKINAQLLKPVNEAIDLKAKISYNQGDRAWNIIRIRKDIIKEFPSLKDKRDKFSYRMILHKSYEDLEKAIKKLKKDRDTMPIMLFLYREKGTIT